jgi:hypothetical protein
MSHRIVRLFIVCALSAAVTACSKSNPAQPSSGASVVAPRPVTPANAALVPNVSQPLTLVVQNGVSTQPGATYTFEIATDPAFTTKVQTKDAVPEGSGGQTSVKLDPLAAAHDYYWHARTVAGGTTGVFGATSKFTVGAAITLGPPIAVNPLSGAQTTSQPSFTVRNATREGQPGAVSYRFDIATSSAFSSIVMTGTVAETTAQTTFTPATELPALATLFWRATALDPANGLTSPPSATQSFITAFAIDLSKVVYLNSPNVSAWPQTAHLSLVEQDGAPPGPVCMTYTDPGWPDTDWPFDNIDTFGVYANQWYFANIGGTWYGGAGEWLYRGVGSCKAGQGTTTIGPDSGFGPPFSTWVPKPGELVGFMVSSVARNGPVKRTVDQRSNVIVQPWHDSALQGFSGAAIRFKK